MGRNFAIDYAPVQPSPYLIWQDGKEPESGILPYQKGDGDDREASENARRKFIDGLGPDDTLWLEMGPTHRLALAAYRQGAQIRRISGHHTKVTRTEMGLEKSETAQVLHRLATTRSDLFYPYEEQDEKVAEVGMLAKSFLTIQKDRKRNVQRFEAVQRDLYLVDPIGEVDVELAVTRRLARMVYFSGALEESPDKKLPKLVEDMFKELETAFRDQLERHLNKLPIYQGVFKHIPLCGPGMSGIMIWKIADVAFFETPPMLRHYAGLHILPDGRKARKRAGVQSDWDPALRQAFWLFGQEVMHYGRADNPWRQAFDWRLEYEKNHVHPGEEKKSDKQLYFIRKERAGWWLAQKLSGHIWRQWRVFKAGGEYQPYDFECLRV